MKIHSFSFKFALVFGVVAALAICITQQVFSQEPAKKETTQPG